MRALILALAVALAVGGCTHRQQTDECEYCWRVL